MFQEYDDIVLVKDLMKMLKIGKNKAYRLLQSGQIKARKDQTGYWIIQKMAVIEYTKTEEVSLSHTKSPGIMPL